MAFIGRDEPGAALDGYLRAAGGRLAGVLGHDLVGVYLHGSAVLGGWSAGQSDLLPGVEGAR